MPNCPPPEAYRGRPARFTLRAGTELARIHDGRFSATSFNPTLADRHWGGGRFDATEDDPYGYLYASQDDGSAVAEVLLRDLPLTEAGSRLLPQRAITGRKISWIAPKVNLELVSLQDGRDLAEVGQDSWLTKCDSREYAFTRRWGHQIREWAPWSQGFVWRSKREESSLAYVFFEDRGAAVFKEVADTILAPPEGNWLDRGPGRLYVRQILAEYNVTLFT